MPRLARVDVGGHVYHVINRANGRLKIFETQADYQLFEKIPTDTKEEMGMRILAYTIMPNHWHLVLYPVTDGELGTFMHRLTNKHTHLFHTQTRTIGHRHLYQGRYKSSLVDQDSHLLTLIKYVERNPVRARLTMRGLEMGKRTAKDTRYSRAIEIFGDISCVTTQRLSDVD